MCICSAADTNLLFPEFSHFLYPTKEFSKVERPLKQPFFYAGNVKTDNGAQNSLAFFLHVIVQTPQRTGKYLST